MATLLDKLPLAEVVTGRVDGVGAATAYAAWTNREGGRGDGGSWLRVRVRGCQGGDLIATSRHYSDAGDEQVRRRRLRVGTPWPPVGLSCSR